MEAEPGERRGRILAASKPTGRVSPIHVADPMQIDFKLAVLFCAIQAFVFGLVSLMAVRGYSDKAGASLRIRSWALLFEGTGLLVVALGGGIKLDWYSVLVSSILQIIPGVLTVYALRTLLGLRQYRAAIAAAAFTCWLAMLWFGVVQPNTYGYMICVGVITLGYIGLMSWPLRRCLRQGGSYAERVLLGALLTTMLIRCLHLRDPVSIKHALTALQSLTAANVIQLTAMAILPLLTSVAFLLMYNEAMQAQLKDLARTDPLTGVNNRLALTEWLARLLEQATRRDRPLAVLLIDIDHFKEVNDRHGHAGGDKVLLELIACLRATLRRADVIGRVGGEEFVVLAPDTDLIGGLQLGERLRKAAEALVPFVGGQPLTLTISVGVAVSIPAELDIDALLGRADLALYVAKHAGRNQVAEWRPSRVAGTGLSALSANG